MPVAELRQWKRFAARWCQGNARWASDFERQEQNSLGPGAARTGRKCGGQATGVPIFVLDQGQDKFVVGKALEPMQKGTGVIQVLVTLQ